MTTIRSALTTAALCVAALCVGTPSCTVGVSAHAIMRKPEAWGPARESRRGPCGSGNGKQDAEITVDPGGIISGEWEVTQPDGKGEVKVRFDVTGGINFRGSGKTIITAAQASKKGKYPFTFNAPLTCNGSCSAQLKSSSNWYSCFRIKLRGLRIQTPPPPVVGPFCGTFVCPGGFAKKPGDKTLKCNGTCDTRMCCNLKPLVPVTLGQTTCVTHRCTTGQRKDFAERIGCPSTGCNNDLCCDQVKYCDAHACPAGRLKKPFASSLQCRNGDGWCGDDGCCQPRTGENEVKPVSPLTRFSCAGFSQCLPGLFKPNLAFLPCADGNMQTKRSACTLSECCDPAMRCNDYDCGANQRPKLNNAATKCKTSQCTSTECCRDLQKIDTTATLPARVAADRGLQSADNKIAIFWRIDSKNQAIQFTVSSISTQAPRGWVGIAIQPTTGPKAATKAHTPFMDTYLFFLDPRVNDLKTQSGHVEIASEPIADETNHMTKVGYSAVGKKLVVTFTRPLDTKDAQDIKIEDGQEYLLSWAMHDTEQDFFSMHTSKGSKKVNLFDKVLGVDGVSLTGAPTADGGNDTPGSGSGNTTATEDNAAPQFNGDKDEDTPVFDDRNDRVRDIPVTSNSGGSGSDDMTAIIAGSVTGGVVLLFAMCLCFRARQNAAMQQALMQRHNTIPEYARAKRGTHLAMMNMDPNPSLGPLRV